MGAGVLSKLFKVKLTKYRKGTILDTIIRYSLIGPLTFRTEIYQLVLLLQYVCGHPTTISVVLWKYGLGSPSEGRLMHSSPPCTVTFIPTETKAYFSFWMTAE